MRDVSSSDGGTASESEEIARWPKTTAHGEARIIVDSLSAEERQTVTEVLIGLRDVDATLEDIETLDFEPHAEDEPTEQFTIKFKPHLNRLGRVVEVPAGLFDELWG